LFHLVAIDIPPLDELVTEGREIILDNERPPLG